MAGWLQELLSGYFGAGVYISLPLAQVVFL